MTEFVLALALVFVTAGLLLLIANHFGLPPVPVYIIAGLLTGPFIAQPALIDLALWGIAFLVFVFGIQVDLGDIRRVLRDGEVAGFTQLLVVAPVAFGVGYAFGGVFGFEDPVRNAIYFSAAATLSSTLVGGRALEQEIRNNLVYGRLASSIHFFDDIVAIGAVLVLSAEVLTDAQLITSKIGFGVLFLLAGLVFYRHGFPVLVRIADRDDELVLLGSISILIAFIAAAELVGISIVVGAFAAGLAVRSDRAGLLGVRNGIDSIKDFFAAIFFVTVGALVAVPTAEVLVVAGALIVLVVVFNPVVYMLAFVFEGYDGRTAFLAGSGLNQVSELSLVIVIQAWLLGTITEGMFDAVILAAAATMILSALTSRYEHRVYDSVIHRVFAGRTRYIDEHSRIADGVRDHVVLIGYGRHGRRLTEALEALGEPYVVIENDPARLDALEADCQGYVFGDAMAEYPLDLAGIRAARLVVSTVNHRPLSESVLQRDTDAEIILRADTSREAQELLDSGAFFVFVPSVLASDQLVENIERVLGDEREAGLLEKEQLAFFRMLEVAGLEDRLSYR